MLPIIEEEEEEEEEEKGQTMPHERSKEGDFFRERDTTKLLYVCTGCPDR